MRMKELKDLDKNHPFYSLKAAKEWKSRIRRLIQEEEEMIQENQRRYRKRIKIKEGETNGH